MEQINIKGVSLRPLKHISVPKGDIYHALKCTDEGYAGFGEAYFSQIESGEVKGWKRHNRMTLNIIVPVGKIKFVIFDDREGSKTYGMFQEIIISPEDNYQRLTLAPGLWMAFQGMDRKTSMLMDIIPEPHDPTEADRKDLKEIAYKF
ncbi:dTDP-4-dehydrorhamnose 3,5-epimerase [Phocaeicola plebeius]|jgi:dTDP-4-dehydrorhamnose 3,5-epimerase|uniref:dTDP-4-dehydrorhamnose 3,5-epimerase n=1 Tax=Phocaeicola plebeius TaxID=310297 RepID=UPI00356634CA